jgi:hypothetical protein
MRVISLLARSGGPGDHLELPLILGYPVVGKAGEKVESARRIEQSGTVIVQRGKGNDDGGTLWKGA